MQYEYRIEEINPRIPTSEMLAFLNDLGGQGWEYCDMLPRSNENGLHFQSPIPWPRWVFKRLIVAV